MITKRTYALPSIVFAISLFFFTHLSVNGISLSNSLGTPSLSPQDVVIEIQSHVPPGGPGYGPFVASGPAVEAGLVCATGDTLDVKASVDENQGDEVQNLQVFKEFTCADGSGSFVMKLEVLISPEGVQATWMIFSGSGDYANLHGTGRLTSSTPAGGDILDETFGGKLHN